MPDYQGPPIFPMPMAADVHIHKDVMVGEDGDGHAVPASHPRCRQVRGHSEDEVNNIGGAKGAHRIMVREGTYFQEQDGSITQADLGKPCFAVDDNTVSLSDAGGTRPPAGGIVPVQKQPFTTASRVLVCFDSSGDSFDVAN